jgi:hypothetical protein
MVVPPPSPEPHKRVKKIVIQRGLMKKRKKGWSIILNKICAPREQLAKMGREVGSRALCKPKLAMHLYS